LIRLSTFTDATMCHALAVGSLNRRDSVRSSASPVVSRIRKRNQLHDRICSSSMATLARRHRIAIGKSDQGNVQVSSIHDARVAAASPEPGLRRPGSARPGGPA
jgi:hypothetical protein